MGKKNFGTNIRLTSPSLLKEVESYSEFCNSIIQIRTIFGFTGEVTLEEVPNLKTLERKVGGSLPEWVIGLSAGKRIWIIKKNMWKNKKMDVSQLILHEFVHIALSQCMKKRIPLWLNEGLAVYLSGQYKDYKLEQSHIRAYVDFNELSYQSEYFYIIAAKMLVALIKEYGINEVIKEIMLCKDFESSSLFQNENLNRIIQEESRE